MIDREKYREMLDQFLQPGQTYDAAIPKPLLIDPSTASSKEAAATEAPQILTGKCQVMEDNIDTDAIIPAVFMPGKNDEDLGTHCFEFVAPEFRQKVKDGQNIVVAGIGFGSGSSREEAVRALKGIGVQAVIAKSFAFIYARNQPNMGLLGIRMTNPRFHELATENADISIDVPGRTVTVANETFPFSLSEVEERLLLGGGVIELYKKHNKKLFRAVVGAPLEDTGCGTATTSSCGDDGSRDLDW